MLWGRFEPKCVLCPHFWGEAEVKCHGTDSTGQIGALGNNKQVNLISIK